EMTGLGMPEVVLPEPVILPAESEPRLSLDDVMAAPIAAINPPAQDVPPSLLPPPADEEPVDDELLEVFIEEAAEVLETIDEYLPRWHADHEDKEALTEVRRAFHRSEERRVGKEWRAGWWREQDTRHIARVVGV